MNSEYRQHVEVVGCRVDVSDVHHAAELLAGQAQEHQGGYACLANVHMCMEAQDDPQFTEVLRQAAFVFADGRPVYWAQRLCGASQARQVRGVDLVLALCAKAEQTGLKLGLYGGQSDARLQQLQVVLLKQFPQLQLVYAWAPPFRPLTSDEDGTQRLRIKEAQVDCLLVGLGCPKQEIWMFAHRDLPVTMLGVGAAFDFIAGVKSQAPVLVQKLGLEWLYRLIQEPVRLSSRYVKHNPRFMWRLVRQWLNRQKNTE